MIKIVVSRTSRKPSVYTHGDRPGGLGGRRGPMGVVAAVGEAGDTRREGEETRRPSPSEKP